MLPLLQAVSGKWLAVEGGWAWNPQTDGNPAVPLLNDFSEAQFLHLLMGIKPGDKTYKSLAWANHIDAKEILE